MLYCKLGSMNNHQFVKYLLVSLLGHFAIAFVAYLIAGFGMLGGLGNASSSYFNSILALLLGALIILIFFQIYLYKRKTITIAQKFLISTLPLFLGVLIFFNIDRFGTSMIKLSSSRKLEKSRQFVHFDTHFKLDTVESKQRISVSFVLDKEMGINTFMSSYRVELGDIVIDADKSAVSECPMINDIFTSVEGENSIQYTRNTFYGDGELLPPGEYLAIKSISPNVTVEMEDFCNKKIENILVNEGAKIYFSDIYGNNPGLRELVVQIKYVTQ